MIFVWHCRFVPLLLPWLECQWLVCFVWVCVCVFAGDSSGGDDNVWHLLRFDYILAHSTAFRTEPKCLSFPLPIIFVIFLAMPIYLRILFPFFFLFTLWFHSSRVEFGWKKKLEEEFNFKSSPTDARCYGRANRLEPMNASSPHSNGLRIRSFLVFEYFYLLFKLLVEHISNALNPLLLSLLLAAVAAVESSSSSLIVVP